MALFIHSFVWRYVHSLFQNEFCAECELVLHLSIYSGLFFPLKLFSSCLRLLPRLLVTYIFPLIFLAIKSIRQFLRKMWPIQLDFLPFIVCCILLSSSNLCELLHFLRVRFNWSSPSFSSTTF
jgi:hypothetical protein